MGEKRELNDDLLKGAKAAAEYIGAGVTPRIIYGMVESGFLPVVKTGPARNAILFFRKSAIDAAFKAEIAA